MLCKVCIQLRSELMSRSVTITTVAQQLNVSQIIAINNKIV